MAKKDVPAAERREAAKKQPKVQYDTLRPGIRVAQLPVMALALALVVELCNRGLSLQRLWDFVTGSPLAFLYNALIILTTLSVSELFKRRKAMLTATAILWLALGVVEFFVVKYRTQPFCSVDVVMIKDAFSIITVYFTWPQIILMFGAGFAIVAALLMMFARLRRRRRVRHTPALLAIFGLTTLCVMFSAIGMRSGFFPRRFDDLVDAYNKYGFATCFAFTFGQQGINRPEEYSTETVAEILKDIDNGTETESELSYPVFHEQDRLDKPNILFIQLESFFDVGTIEGSEVSRDPTPNFNRLCRYFPSGLLYVPTIGGGTANTEFEVLTGLNVDFFGTGEYPYNTILQQTAVESVCTDLKAYGYAATAMHNNNGNFYSRNVVYPNLGFDRFVSLEYMQDMKYTAMGWAKDAELTDEILRALESTQARDVVMCISVESHGKYAETYEPQAGDIEVVSLPEGIPLAPFQNFINIIPDTDNFLNMLVYRLSRFEEPTVVVAYGDHLPALELSNDMMTTGSIYASRYVIWNNFGKVFEAPDLQAYRLTAHVMQQLGFTGDVIAKYHQASDPGEAGEEYLDKLEMLQYDMLYGDKTAYEGESPYVPTNMIMGSVPIEILDAALEYHRLLVSGENFTEYSTIYVGNTALQTVYVDRNHIAAHVDDGTEIPAFHVAQVSKDGVVLSQTEECEMAK